MPNLQTQHTAFAQSAASKLRTIDLPDASRLVEYKNSCERVFYENEKMHTFSLYLEGGYSTWRTDQQGPNGAPNHFCLMPKGSYSAWEVGSEQNFVHLYFSDEYLKRLALTTFDIDPRLVSLPQLTFDSNQGLDAIVRHSIMNWNWQGVDSTLAVELGVQTLLVNLIASLGINQVKPVSLTSGLSPPVQRRVLEFINMNLIQQISLCELAAVAELSEFHFARMFKISFAQTPQQFISRQRIALAQQLLGVGKGMSLADISFRCGFSSQSHFGRMFKQYVGVTPGVYRKSI